MKIWIHARVAQETATLRSEPNDSSPIISQLHPDTELVICSFDPGWVEARLPDGARGFIIGKSTFQFWTSGTVIDKGVSLYHQPDHTSQVARQIARGESIVIVKAIDKGGQKWIQASTTTGEKGYLPGTTKVTNTQKVTTREGVWTCHKCFEVNSDTLKSCGNCNVPLEQQPTSKPETPLFLFGTLLLLLAMAFQGLGAAIASEGIVLSSGPPQNIADTDGNIRPNPEWNNYRLSSVRVVAVIGMIFVIGVTAIAFLIAKKMQTPPFAFLLITGVIPGYLLFGAWKVINRGLGKAPSTSLVFWIMGINSSILACIAWAMVQDA